MNDPRTQELLNGAVDDFQIPTFALIEGFNRHYALFRECARAARRHFDAGNWLAIQHVGRPGKTGTVIVKF